MVIARPKRLATGGAPFSNRDKLSSTLAGCQSALPFQATFLGIRNAHDFVLGQFVHRHAVVLCVPVPHTNKSSFHLVVFMGL
jgi:hypothetical protein